MADRAGIQFTVTVEGLDELLGKVPNDQKRQKVAMTILHKLGVIAVAAGMAEAPRRTGNLQRSIMQRTTGDMEITVGSVMRYADYVERGTGIYGPFATPVVSPTGGVMAWPGGTMGPGGTLRLSGAHTVSGSDMAFSRSTKGMPAHPFMQPARDATEAAMAAVIDEASQALFGGG